MFCSKVLLAKGILRLKLRTRFNNRLIELNLDPVGRYPICANPGLTRSKTYRLKPGLVLHLVPVVAVVFLLFW